MEQWCHHPEHFGFCKRFVRGYRVCQWVQQQLYVPGGNRESHPAVQCGGFRSPYFLPGRIGGLGSTFRLCICLEQWRHNPKHQRNDVGHVYSDRLRQWVQFDVGPRASVGHSQSIGRCNGIGISVVLPGRKCDVGSSSWRHLFMEQRGRHPEHFGDVCGGVFGCSDGKWLQHDVGQPTGQCAPRSACNGYGFRFADFL